MKHFVGHYFDEKLLPFQLRKKGVLFVSGSEKMRFSLNSGGVELKHGELYIIPYHQQNDKEEVKPVWGEIRRFEDARGAGIDTIK